MSALSKCPSKIPKPILPNQVWTTIVFAEFQPESAEALGSKKNGSAKSRGRKYFRAGRGARSYAVFSDVSAVAEGAAHPAVSAARYAGMGHFEIMYIADLFRSVIDTHL